MRPARWVTAIGAWGDILAALGNVFALYPDPQSRQSLGIIHYGADRHIPAFLKAQGFGEVVQVRETDPIDYWAMLRRCCDPKCPRSEWLPELLDKTGIDPETVACTHTLNINCPVEIHRWSNPALPERSRVWARTILAELGVGEFYLLNPRSEQSTPWQAHWPHWEEAVRWLASTGEQFVWVGAGYEAWVKGPNVINLIQLTPTMMEVFALADLSRGIVSTSNSLSMWSVMTDKSALIAHNQSMIEENYFKAWVTQFPPNRIVEHWDGLATFRRHATELMGPGVTQSRAWSVHCVAATA